MQPQVGATRLSILRSIWQLGVSSSQMLECERSQPAGTPSPLRANLRQVLQIDHDQVRHPTHIVMNWLISQVRQESLILRS
ncbi:hypothetical protein D3C85_1588410 [compost metagenome]